MKEITIDNTLYRIGKNAEDNTQMVRYSDGVWYWFHLGKFPSCHVVACKNDIGTTEIINACDLVKKNSKYKFANIEIHYCKIKNLVLCEKPGSVTFKSNRKVDSINI